MEAVTAAAGPGTGFVQRTAARLTGSPWFWSLFIGTLFVVPIIRSVGRPLPPAPPVLGAFPRFSLIDQAGHAFSEKDVRGQIVIAEFVPALSLASGERSPLAALQKRVRNTAGAVHLVSFVKGAGSPATPDRALSELARREGAGAWRWTLAGGEGTAGTDPVASLENEALRALRAPAGTTLGGRLILVDSRGRVRRFVGTTTDDIDLMMRDIGILVNLEGVG